MSLTLLALHGFTQNGALFEAQLAELATQLPKSVDIICPDAPHPCSEGAIQRIAAAFNLERQTPPHLCWWDASDDGKVYHGLETTLSQLRALCEDRERVGVLGFSQGAIVASALAALQHAGQFPPLAFVVLVAGRKPRAELLQPLMAAPLPLPSLHVWGELDAGAREASPALVEAFAEDTRQVVRWRGPHAVPTRGAGADAIVEFVTRFS